MDKVQNPNNSEMKYSQNVELLWLMKTIIQIWMRIYLLPLQSLQQLSTCNVTWICTPLRQTRTWNLSLLRHCVSSISQGRILCIMILLWTRTNSWSETSLKTKAAMGGPQRKYLHTNYRFSCICYREHLPQHASCQWNPILVATWESLQKHALQNISNKQKQNPWPLDHKRTNRLSDRHLSTKFNVNFCG
jgi:hypothetical protein